MNSPETIPPLPPLDEPEAASAAHAATTATLGGSEFPEDLRAPWGWTDLLLLLLIAMAGLFLLSNAVALVFFSMGVTLTRLRTSPAERSLFLLVNQALFYVGLLAYLYVHLRNAYRAPFWRALGWRPIHAGDMPRGIAYAGCVLCGALLAPLINLASEAFGKKGALPIEQLFRDRTSAMLFMLMAVLIAPLVEEIIFRGYVYPVLARSFGIAGGVLTTGALFGLLHAQQLWGGWGQIALLMIVGIVFTYVRAITRSVFASYLLHLSYNSFLFLAFLLSPAGFRSLPVSH